MTHDLRKVDYFEVVDTAWSDRDRYHAKAREIVRRTGVVNMAAFAHADPGYPIGYGTLKGNDWSHVLDGNTWVNVFLAGTTFRMSAEDFGKQVFPEIPRTLEEEERQ